MPALHTARGPELSSWIYQRLRKNRRARSLIVKTYPAYARLYGGLPGPRILLNSIPKSGTHLVMSLLDQLPRVRFSGVQVTTTDHSPNLMEVDEGAPVHANIDYLRRRLTSVRKGQYAGSHFHPDPDIVDLTQDLDYARLFLYRDPRDVLVSHLFFIEKQSQDLHARLMSEFPTREERLLALIGGFPSSPDGRGMAPLLGYANYLGWLDVPGVLCVRFEDLIGARGGGSETMQLSVTAKIAEHVGRPLDDASLSAVAERVWSGRSGTFRRGEIGSWRSHFTEEHKRKFKDVAGEQLVALGYEGSDDW